MKILVADMLSAYDQYKAGHAALFTATTAKELHQASRDTVENYLENRRIWKELQHYRDKGVLLGKHPIFDRLKRSDLIRSMKIMALVHLKGRLENNLVRNRSAIHKQPDHPNTRERQERILQMEMELAEVNRLLNL